MYNVRVGMAVRVATGDMIGREVGADVGDGWVPIDEAMRRARITEAMAYRLIKRGVLEARRTPRRGGAPGRPRARVSITSLNAYIAAHVTQGQTQPAARESAPTSTPDQAPSRAMVAYDPVGAVDRAAAWAALPDGELHRRAAAAAHARDAHALWDLTEAYLLNHGQAGARVSAHTLRAYRHGVGALAAAWRGENLLRPSRDAGPRWLRALEAAGKRPATVRLRLAAGRALYAALRWARATDADPFAHVRAAPDTTARWDLRRPYGEGEVAALLARADAEGDPTARLLVLLGAHAGLRISEALALMPADIDRGRDELHVQRGKGRKERHIPLSATLASALSGPGGSRGASGLAGGGGDTATETPLPLPLPFPHALAARERLRHLATTAGVAYRGYHALRHYCGTRLMRETGDLDTVARVLGHSSIETARVYAKWSDQGAKNAIGHW
jgi:integrase